MSVADNLARVRDKIRNAAVKANRSADDVRLIAVSKRQPDELLHEAYAAGQRDFGENYAQELERKMALLPSDARFHMIGHVQSNKAKKVAAAFRVHTVDSARLGKALSKAEASASVLVQVKQGDEATKDGVLPGELLPLLDALKQQDKLRIEGLMSIPPAGQGPRYFGELADLAEEMRRLSGLSLPELSMGMSADFEEAITYGATWVRVGTAIFGARNLPNTDPSA